MMNPEKCYCRTCRKEGTITLPHSQVDDFMKAIAAAVEVAYDPGKQPAMVLTLIELGFINTAANEFPILDE